MSLILLLLLAATAFAKPRILLPSYVKPCARLDPDFNTCALAHAKETFPKVINGDRKYKVPPLDPLYIEEVNVVNGGPRQAGLSLTMKKAKVYGLKTSEITQTNFNFDTKHVQHKMTIPRTEIIGKYDISGNVLLLPIVGSGDLNITLLNVEVVFDHDYQLRKPENSDDLHMVLTDHKTTVTPSRMFILATNLFNGDKFLSKQMNEFMNENWKDVYTELSPAVVSVFSEIIQSIINGIAVTVPFDIAFPEKL